MIVDSNQESLIIRIRNGNANLKKIWNSAVAHSNDTEIWVAYLDVLDRGFKKLYTLAYWLKLIGYNDCVYGDQKYTCQKDESRFCFCCTYNPPAKCHCCGGGEFWFRQGDWICSTCHPKPC